MKTKLNLWPALSAALLLAIPFVGKCDATVPGMINYQGRLTDTLGNPVSSGYYEIKFLLWADATRSDAGELVWGRTFALHVVQDGLFNILLSDNGSKVTTPSVPTTDYLLDAFDGPRWLGLTIVQSNGVPIEAARRRSARARNSPARHSPFRRRRPTRLVSTG